MKLREMVRQWPPRWGGSYGRGDASGEVGVLKAVEAREVRPGITTVDRVAIRFEMEHEGEVYGAMSVCKSDSAWRDRVVAMLQARIGQPVKGLGDVEVGSPE